MNNIIYEGLVTVKIYNGKKLLATKTYHNSGSQNLFKFLSQCLAGNYKTAEQLRPCMLKLFNFSESPVTPSTWTWTTDYTKTMTDASAFINISTSTEAVPVEATDTTEATYSAVLHFRVPYSYILQNKVYVVAAYPSTTTNNDDYIAYYKLTKSNDDDWDPINIDAGSSNSNIVIDWTMTFNNKSSN